MRNAAGRLDPYYELEHERWMAYVRTEGWRLPTRGGDTLEEIRECYEEYCSQFKNQNYLVRLHPALVPIHRQAGGTATLQEVDDMIVETNLRKGEKEYNPDYVRSDVELVDHIGDIVAGAWCGPEGISIHGVRAKEGECVICTLEDMLEYYIRIYQDQKVAYDFGGNHYDAGRNPALLLRHAPDRQRRQPTGRLISCADPAGRNSVEGSGFAEMNLTLS